MQKEKAKKNQIVVAISILLLFLFSFIISGFPVYARSPVVVIQPGHSVGSVSYTHLDVYKRQVIVRVEYNVKNINIKSPVLGIAIRTIDNRYVCGLNTLLDKKNIPWEKGKNVFYLRYNKMGLLSGEYYFDIALFEENATVPLVYKTKYINMFITGKYVGEGIVVLDHEWKEKV